MFVSGLKQVYFLSFFRLLSGNFNSPEIRRDHEGIIRCHYTKIVPIDPPFYSIIQHLFPAEHSSNSQTPRAESLVLSSFVYLSLYCIVNYHVAVALIASANGW